MATRDRYVLRGGFPASEQDAVRDAAHEAGRHPLVVFSHGFGGHRRQSTFITTHLASQGYVVAAPDHAGTTLTDVLHASTSARRALEMRTTTALLEEAARSRPADVRGVIEAAIGLGRPSVDTTRIGVVGHSLGGWTAIVATARDRRISSAVLLAPAGGTAGAVDDPLRRGIDFAWGREVPTLLIAAARDSVLPLAGMTDTHARIPSRTKQLVVLPGADHFHFCDRADRLHELMRRVNPIMPPASTLQSTRQSEPIIRALVLAHLDAHLRTDVRAQQWIAEDFAA